jgi:hypothetical protein
LSNARDDETGERYWESFADGWAKEHRRELSRPPAVKTGFNQHLVNWDMRNPIHTQRFVDAVGRFYSDVEQGLLLHNAPNATKGAWAYC